MRFRSRTRKPGPPSGGWIRKGETFDFEFGGHVCW